MTLSMTGFGKAQFTYEGKSFTVEIRCLNSKQQDVSIRISNKYKAKEVEIRNLLIEQLVRGKIELNIYSENSNENKSVNINKAAFLTYSEQIKELTGKAASDEVIAAILRLPEVIGAEKEELVEEEFNALFTALKKACEEVLKFRSKEGLNLQKDLSMRNDMIAQKLALVEKTDANRLAQVRNKLNTAVKDIQEGLLDKNRFEQELIYYLEKIDVTEEKVRLKSHLDYFNETLTLAGEKGKKLGFISQEMGREINTMGSKANDSDLQKIVVEMKDELEKIKEQLLNIL